MTLLGRLMTPLFAVTPTDIPALSEDDETTARLRQVVLTVTECCRTTLLHSRFDVLVPRLEAYPDELRGFAYEGAGVGLAALDHGLRWKRRTRDFVTGHGAPYRYAVYLGAGMSIARMRRDPEPFRVRLADPLFSWVVLDGYGFHEGFFAHRRAVREQRVPSHLSGYGRRAFDHGLGRSIWFSCGASVPGVVATIGSFAEDRRPDLWSGVGTACCYTGGVDRATVEALRAAAGPSVPDLAVGVAIAARAREAVHNVTAHNEIACDVLCRRTTAEAAGLAESTLADLPPDGAEPAYEVWRRRIRAEFAAGTARSVP